MLVQHILEFIKKLQSEQELGSYDVKFIKSILNHFKKNLPQDKLDSDGMNFLIECFEYRWDEIRNDNEDYTLNASVANQTWIDLAKKLSIEVNIPYLKILFYDITNDKDPVDDSALTETEHLTNFYIGENNLLYRKRAFFDHMQSRNYELSTYKYLPEKQLSVVTVEELSRLKRCKQSKGNFSIRYSDKNSDQNSEGVEYFDSFWDFMRKKPFPGLAQEGELPGNLLGLLPHLLELVDRYYNLKAKNAPFDAFKNAAGNFFTRLYGYDLTDVNCLYGQTVSYNGGKHYLLDVFISVLEADKYELDQEMIAISKFLVEFNPVLKALSKELLPLYEQLSKKEAVRRKSEQFEAYERCLSILVSFYVTKFKMFLLSGCSISAWDKENIIPYELISVYNTLRTVFSAPNTSTTNPDYVKAYGDIITDIVKPKCSDNSWWTWFCRDSSTRRWLEQVKDAKLSEVGGYWFEPELIISTLLSFQTNRPDVKKKVNNFLDDLVSTYAQGTDRSDFKKQLRVNILFSQFLSTLNEYQRHNIIILTTLCREKGQFIKNCMLHINKRLQSLGYVAPADVTPQFFRATYKQEINLTLSDEIQSVSAIIDFYSQKLSLNHLENGIQEKIQKYYIELKNPILTVSEKEAARKSVQQTNVDNIGAPT